MHCSSYVPGTRDTQINKTCLAPKLREQDRCCDWGYNGCNNVHSLAPGPLNSYLTGQEEMCRCD